VARFFLRRQAVQMPAYGGRLTDAELDALVAYIRWVRS
jgi:mono/diheme cytochrome c family protein